MLGWFGKAGLLLALACAGAMAQAEPAYLDEVYDLLQQEQYEQAYRLLQRSVTEADQSNPEVMLAMADVSRRYAPQVPWMNGGDRTRVRMLREAAELYRALKQAGIATAYDQQAAIGRRYRRQDEIGTPWCVTIDGQTAEDNTVTLRERDTLEQTRIRIDDVVAEISARLNG